MYQSVKTIMSYLATIALCLVGRVMPASVSLSEENKTHNMDWVSYHSMEDIYRWFEYLETKYEFCNIEIIGKTFENRDMRVMKVSLHHLFYLGTSCAVTVSRRGNNGVSRYPRYQKIFELTENFD